MDDEDKELQAIRARRMAELQQQQGRRQATGSSAGDSGQEQRQKEDEMRSSMLTQILSQEAGARRESCPPFLCALTHQRRQSIP